MTGHAGGTIDRVSRPDFTNRGSTRVLSLRDVADVEAYVIDTLHEVAIPLDDGDLEQLVAFGIASVYRLERALPPERPLLPLLERVLSARLTDLWGSVQLDRAASSNRPAAIAA
jgi:hypothetical protein